MKTFSLINSVLFMVCITGSSISNAQVIYIKQDAPGIQDGSSWWNAYHDLQVAIDQAPDGAQLWIAAGIYHPGGATPAPQSVFSISHPLFLYGGFVGNEAELQDRDPETNYTILSGDLLDNDITDDFDNNKTDNTHHVVYIHAGQEVVTIDGCRIEGGQTLSQVGLNEYNRSGGGIFAEGRFVLNHCTLLSNFGRAGGALFIKGSVSNSVIYHCTFEHNKGTNNAAGILVDGAADILIKQCVLHDNFGTRGTIQLSLAENILVDSTVLRNNINSVAGTAGGGITSLRSRNVQIRHCEFEQNQAPAGGAIFIGGDSIPAGQFSNIKIEDCSFIGNSAWNTVVGGAIYSKANPDITISHCAFRQNTAGNGGAININQSGASWQDTSNVLISYCRFEENISNDFGGGAVRLDTASCRIIGCLFDQNRADKAGHLFMICPGQTNIIRQDTFWSGNANTWGGAATAYGTFAAYQFDQCIFQFNHSDERAGAVHVAIGAQVNFNHCAFTNNESDLGGCIFANSDTTSIAFYQTIFMNNHSNSYGGAFYLNAGNTEALVEGCRFENNIADVTGGAVFLNFAYHPTQYPMLIRNSWFGQNVAENGAAIFNRGRNLRLESCVLYNQLCNGPDPGGALAISPGITDSVQTSLMNTTLANLEPLQTALLKLHSDSLNFQNLLVLQNCILQNDDASILVMEGNANSVVSRGGNLSADPSMIGILNQLRDLNDVQPIFTDPDYPGYDFSLTTESPGINAGVPDDAPLYDILGNPRVGEIDMGAYENQTAVGLPGDPGRELTGLSITPNLVFGTSPEIHLHHPVPGTLFIQIMDSQGGLCYRGHWNKTETDFHQVISMNNWNPGIYWVNVRLGHQATTVPVTKI